MPSPYRLSSTRRVPPRRAPTRPSTPVLQVFSTARWFKLPCTTPSSRSPAGSDPTPYTSQEPPARPTRPSPRPLTTCSSTDSPSLLSPGFSTPPITPIWPHIVSRRAIPVSPLVRRPRPVSSLCGRPTAAFHPPHRHHSRVAPLPESGAQLPRINRDHPLP